MSTRKSAAKTQFRSESTADINQLLDRVEKPIADWLKTNDYRKRTLTIKKTAELIGISREDFRLYLKYIVQGNLQRFLAPRRVEYAKFLMFVEGGVLSREGCIKAGFSDIPDYYNAFEQVEGILPTEWTMAKNPGRIAFEKQLSEEIKCSMNNVKKALDAWERNMGHRRSRLTTNKVAKAIGVSVDDLYCYCCLELHDTILHWIELQRIYDAKMILSAEPKKRINAVSSMLGYDTPLAFRNSFERVTGTSLDSWRETLFPNKRPKTEKNTAEQVFDVEPITQWKRKKGYCRPGLTQKDVARIVGFSEARFAQYLQLIEKKPFSIWLSNLRIEEAKRLLSRNLSLTILQVAAEVGLPNKTLFYSTFLQHTGMTPDTWREMSC